MSEKWECFDCGWQGTRPGWRADHTSDCMECPNCGGNDLEIMQELEGASDEI